MRILVDEDGEVFTRIPTPCPLPDDVVIKNLAYAKKLLAGLIDPVTGETLELAADASGAEGAATGEGSASRLGAFELELAGTEGPRVHEPGASERVVRAVERRAELGNVGFFV